MVESLGFGQYMTNELFKDVDLGSYLPSGKKIGICLLSGTLAFSGCSKEKKSGLKEGDILAAERVELAGDGKNYVLLDFPDPP
jgi:hypothetical protein